MFTHLLVVLLLDSVFAAPPEQLIEQVETVTGHAPWPLEQAVTATVHGVQQDAPYSGLGCVYVEWTTGRIDTKHVEKKWISFEHPTASDAALVFRTVGGAELRVHPSVVRFFLVPSFEGPVSSGASPARTDGVLEQGDTGVKTVKEYCLLDGQKVTVKRHTEVYWLPPDTEQGSPKQQQKDRFSVIGLDGEPEETPSSMAQ